MVYNRVILEDKSINPILYDKSKKVYIYSTSVYAKKILYIMLQNKVRIWGFVKNKNEVIGKIYNLPIFSLQELEIERSIFIVAEEETKSFADYVGEMYLVNTEINGKTEFCFGRSLEKKCNAALMLSMILSRCSGKQCFFFINQEEFNFWENLINVNNLVVI